MRVSLQIARRYLFGKKRTNAINYITGISVLGIAIGTAALVLILSVFNGFETLTRKHLDSFNPDIRIIPVSGKFFKINNEQVAILNKTEGILNYSRTIEEVAHFEYNSRQQIGIIKGVDGAYLKVTAMDQAIKNGEAKTTTSLDRPTAIIGNGVYRNLNISLQSKFHVLKVSVPNRQKRGVLDRDFKTRSLDVSGVFSVRSERDNQYIITDYELVSGMLALNDQISSLEISIDDSFSQESIVGRLRSIFSEDNYRIEDRIAQDASVLKIMNIEKWSSYLIFSFTLILIIFNVIGCLWMIVLDKKKDISVLQSFGATKKMVKNIFLIEGLLISTVGFGIGILVSVCFYILQKTIGIITVPDGFDIVNYPMEMEVIDVAIIFLTVMSLGVIASLPAAFRASRVTAYVRME